MVEFRIVKTSMFPIDFLLYNDVLYSVYYIIIEEIFMSGTRTISVNRWGNGLGIRLPKEFTVLQGITESSKLVATITGNALTITHAKEPRMHIPLAKRLKGWEGHSYELTDEDREWLDMEPAGDEIW